MKENTQENTQACTRVVWACTRTGRSIVGWTIGTTTINRKQYLVLRTENGKQSLQLPQHVANYPYSDWQKRVAFVTQELRKVE